MPRKRKRPRGPWAAEFPNQEVKPKKVKLASGTEMVKDALVCKLGVCQTLHNCHVSIFCVLVFPSDVIHFPPKLINDLDTAEIMMAFRYFSDETTS